MQFKLWVKFYSHSTPCYATSSIDNDYSNMGYAFLKVVDIDIDEADAVNKWDAFTKEQKVNERTKLLTRIEEIEAQL